MWVFVDHAATAADDTDRMRKVLENRAKQDEERMVKLEEELKLGRTQAENADKKYDEGAKKLAKIESDLEKAEERADTGELKDERGNDETGAHVEQMYNYDGEFIGGAISIGYGHGVDLPIDWEINFDKCHNDELWRFHWKDLYNMIWV